MTGLESTTMSATVGKQVCPMFPIKKNMVTLQNREELLCPLRQHTQNEFPLISPSTNQSRSENQLEGFVFICLPVCKHSIGVFCV